MAKTYVLDGVQKELYNAVVQCYRPLNAQANPARAGLIIDQDFESTPYYADMPCYRESTPDATSPTPAGRATQDIMDTADRFHIPLTYTESGTEHPVRIGGNWRLVYTTPDTPNNQDSGLTFITIGQAYPKPRFAKKQIIRARYQNP